MNRMLLYLIILIPVAGTVFPQDETVKDFSDYTEMRQCLGELCEKEMFDKAAMLLEKHLERFPEHLMANVYNLAYVYSHLKAYDKALDYLLMGLDRGVWFGERAFDQEFWNPLRKLEGFQKFMKQNEACMLEAQQLARPELQVVLPEQYDAQKKYPLFVALHGGGGNMTGFQEVWKSDELIKSFITAYPQSSQIITMNGYTWTQDIEKSKQEITDVYHKVLKMYSVDENQVIIGGFSSGAIAALEVVLCDMIPVAGFVVLCPAKPESFLEKSITEAMERGVRGTIITTEMDPRLSVQNEMTETLKTCGFPYRFIVTPNIGHWIPENIGQQIDDAISHIFNR